MNQFSLGSELVSMLMVANVALMAVGATFGYAAMSKILNFPALVTGIRGYSLFPARFAPFLGMLLVIGEGLIAVAHLGSLFLQFAVPVTILLLSVFFLGTAMLLGNGQRRPCLCFGASGDDRIDVSSLLRIALLLAVESALWFYFFVGTDSHRVGSSGVGNVTLVMMALLAVTLSGWLFSLLKIVRIWRVIHRSFAIENPRWRVLF